MLFPILICSVATISVIIKKIFYPTDRERTRTLLIDAIDAIEILKQHPDKINWEDAIDAIDAMNAINAIEILKANPDKINWEDAMNVIDAMNAMNVIDAIEILKANPDKINWEDAIDAMDAMGAIEDAIEILKQNPDKISWGNLSKDAMVRNVNIKRSHYTKTSC
jgi:ribosomal protein L24E